MRVDTNFKGSDSSDPSVYFLFCDANTLHCTHYSIIKRNISVNVNTVVLRMKDLARHLKSERTQQKLYVHFYIHEGHEWLMDLGILETL